MLWPESNPARAAVLMLSTTATCFLLNKTFIQLLPAVFQRYRLGKPEQRDTYEFIWKFSNILISLLHSSVSGALCLLSVLWYAEISRDIIDAFQPLPYFALAFTLGYFLYDTYDIYLHRRFYPKYVEILVHHSMIILNFGLAVAEQRYVGSMVIGLLSEVHNVFLHNRTLCRMSGVSRQGRFYQLSIHFNMMTMFLFRTLPYLFILCKYSTISLTGVPHIALPVAVLFWTSIALLFMYNSLLVYRLLNMDYLRAQSLVKRLADDGDRPASEQKVD